MVLRFLTFDDVCMIGKQKAWFFCWGSGREVRVMRVLVGFIVVAVDVDVVGM